MIIASDEIRRLKTTRAPGAPTRFFSEVLALEITSFKPTLVRSSPLQRTASNHPPREGGDNAECMESPLHMHPTPPQARGTPASQIRRCTRNTPVTRTVGRPGTFQNLRLAAREPTALAEKLIARRLYARSLPTHPYTLPYLRVWNFETGCCVLTPGNGRLCCPWQPSSHLGGFSPTGGF